MTANTAPEVSVVVPAYREAARIAASCAEILRFFDAAAVSCEVIVADDGSDDGTAEAAFAAAAEDARVRLVSLAPHKGKGAALRAGILASAGRLVLMIDADLAIPLEEFPAFAAAARSADVVIASKELGRRDGLVTQPFLRALSGRVFNLAVRLLVVPGFLDTQAGFKLFRGDVARRLASQSVVDGFAGDVELLALARRAGLAIVELPVHCRLRTRTSVRLTRDSLRMLRDLIGIRNRLAAGRKSRNA